MKCETNLTALTPSAFYRKNYQIWAIRMETYMEALDPLEALEEDYEVSTLSENPT